MADSRSSVTQEIVDDYLSSLQELTMNSKPLINMLTILAEENIDHASAIVDAVENHLQKVRSEIKLPVLYLIDSIVKNVNQAYLQLFAKNIISTFCHVFQRVDENTRACMWKLRSTWNDVFPTKKLFHLDVKVNAIDPAWPVSKNATTSSSGAAVPPATSIHVNPKFLSMKQQQAKQSQQAATQPAAVAPTPAKIVAPAVVTPPVAVKLPPTLPPSADKAEAEMRDQLLKKQRELLELQKQKIELELLQAKANLEQQRRQLDKQNTLLKPDQIILPDGILDKSLTAMTGPTQPLKPIEKQFPAAAAALMKSDMNKTGKKITPASSVAVAAAKSVTTSRDPRLKSAATSTPATKSTAAPSSDEELAKQKLMHQFQLHMQSKLSGDQSSLLNEATRKGTSEPEKNKNLDNKRAKDACHKKQTSAPITDATNALTTQRNMITKEQSKSSSTKSSSTRNSSSSKTSSSSSSSSSRKVGSKSRSKSSSSSGSPSPNKVAKLEDSSPPSSDSKRSSSKKSSSSSKSLHKPHSPSPSPACTPSSNGSYRIPRRSNNAQDAIATVSSATGKSPTATGLVEEEQSGSLIVSATHPATASFKELRSSTRNRNYVRRNKEGSRSPPEIIIDGDKDSPMPDASKDEDLRAPIVNVNVVASAPLDTKEDLDLRVLAVPTGKRQSSDILESTNVKKSKAEKFDALFGNEDTDLRTLTNPKAGRPPTPPPPVISSENQNKDKGWAKIKTPVKSDRDTPKPLSDRNRDRLGRPRLYSEDTKDRRPRQPTANNDLDDTCRKSDQQMEMIMKQAAEELNHGSISKLQYNKLIQEVLQMSEHQKLRAAQRKEREVGMLVWEKNMEGPNFNSGNDENVHKERPNMHPRGPPGPGGPRWQAPPWHQAPWNHPPPGPFPPGGPHGFPPGGPPDGFRPMGPWQNHPRLFGPGPMRPDFNHFNPRMGAPPMGPFRPPMMMPNGPMNPMMNPMGGGPMGPPMPPGMMMNGPIRPDMKKNNMPNAGPSTNNHNNVNTIGPKATNVATSDVNKTISGSPKNSGELPPANPELLAEIAKDTMKSINIDGIPREIRYYGTAGIVFLSWDDPRDIGFQDGLRRICIDGNEVTMCNLNGEAKEFTYENEKHTIKFGTPTRELYLDGKYYECYFGGRPVPVELGNKTVNISLDGPPPTVKIGLHKRTDLVLGKINLIINARNMVPVFLDAKPQMFEIEGVPCTLEFCDALQTVLLNGRPFKVEFGGLPKPIMVNEKKHFIRFSVLPRGFRAGYVRIANMKGERPKTPPQTEIAEGKSNSVPTTSTMCAVTASTSTATNVSTSIDVDSPSQDGMDVGSVSKTDLQLDVLSSVMPSAMAPSTGQSYQAEPTENAPTPAPAVTLPLDLNTLFQRLVETGIVPSLANLDDKKPEEEEKKEPELNPVTFDKPETLKTKPPNIVTALYSGVQCGACGARWEMATRYSHHLDWHFRQNRKERDSAKKANSRSWFYDVSDWTQYEEVEDMEDRAQNWFETEKQTAEIDAKADDSPSETQQPSVPTGSDENASCVMCHEAFEQFYNEEKEEWHLRPTVTFEDRNYHPLCLEDHKSALEKSALELEEVITEMEEATDKEEVKENEEEKDIEMKEEDVTIKEEEDKVEDDVEMGEESDVKPEIEKDEDDDDKKSIKDQKVKTDEKDGKEEKDIKDEKVVGMDVDDSEPIEIIEPLPRQIVLEEIDDSSEDEDNEVSKKDKAQESNNNKSESKVEEKVPDDVPLIFENVKVKEEPIDDTEAEESIAEAAAVDTTQVEVKSSIDGNVEFQSAASRMPTAPSKIKINITKNLGPKSPPTDSKEKDKKVVESPVETAPAKPLIPAAIKPSLQGKKLSILPTVEKGHELSGLCRLM